MSSVTVLCPGGKRYIVKVTPSKRLLEILEDVCQRQSLKPSHHILKHNRKTLDLSLAFRLSGLPNKAHLDLVPGVGAQADAKVGVALQTPSGERLQKEFASTETLLAIFDYWKQQSGSLQEATGKPVFIYMQQEISGTAALKSATLRSLGLTGGRALIRLRFTSEESASVPSSTAPVTQSPQPPTPTTVLSAPVADPTVTDMAKSLESGTLSCETPDETRCSTEKDALPTVTAPEDVASSSVAAHAVSQNTTSVSVEPEPSSLGSGKEAIDTSTAPPQQQQQQQQAELSSLSAAACAVDCSATPADKEPLEDIDMDVCADDSHGAGVNHVHAMTDAGPTSLAATANDSKSDDTPSEKTSTEPPLPIKSTDSGVTCSKPVTPAAPKEWPSSGGYRLGGSASQDQDAPPPKRPDAGYQSRSETTSQVVELSEPCERHAVLFDASHHQPESQATTEDYPSDDFFEVTAEDLRLVLKDLHSTVGGDSSKPLMTQDMRSKEEQRKLAVYKQAVIRIQFPDKLTLQGFFRPAEPIEAIMDFVKEHLEDSSLQFYLYVAPPKQVLRPLETLAQAKLLPAAKIFFGSAVHRDRYVRADMLQRSSSRSEAENVAASLFGSGSDQERPAMKADAASSAVSSSSTAAAASSQGVKPAKAETVHVQAKKQAALPKWFTLGKK